MGEPKAWLPARADGGPALAVTVAEVLSEVARPVIATVAPTDAARPFPASVTVLCDQTTHGGPLAALANAWTGLPSETRAVFIWSCDTPSINAAALRSLIGQLDQMPDVDAIIPVGEQGTCPLTAVYRPCVGDAIKRLVDNHERRVRRLLETIRWHPFHETADQSVFRNINTPEELDAWRRSSTMKR